ncbi:hypothetical protein V8B97DRAFT_2021235 [Scleroderma yunnanense]
MQEAEEQDTCRICSAPGEPSQPLFYPCKCSGTIRYIHQDCLTTWLSHSKKKTCDVCKHPYSFTKVYAPNMPATLPPLLVVRRIAQQILLAIIFGLRAIMIAIVWLALLPWITIWTWRLYFTMGESTAWWISGRERQLDSPQVGFTSFTAGNESVSLWKNGAILRLTTRPFWQSLSADIFAGQIIASLIVLTFVAVFLLREWISQNARPGVFEEDEFGGPALGDPPVLQPLPAVQPPVEPNRRFNADQPLIDPERDDGWRQARVMRPRRGIAQDGQFDRFPRRPENIERARPMRNLAVPVRQFPNVEPQLAPPPPVPENTGGAIPIGKGKGRGEEDMDADADDEGFAGLRRRTRRRLDSEDQQRDARKDNQPGSSSDKEPPLASSSATAVRPTTFEFTFRAPRTANGDAHDNENVLTGSPPPPVHSLADESRGILHENTSGPTEAAPLWKHVVHPATPPRYNPSPSPSPEVDEQPPSHSTPYEQGASTCRRPPMPNSTIMAEDEDSKLQPTSPFETVPSPGLATYVAPEELEAGPSSAAVGSVDGKLHVGHETEDELNYYFPERQVAVVNDENLIPLGAERVADQNELNDQREPSVEEDEEDEEVDIEAEGEDIRDRDPWDLDADHENDEDDDELENLDLNGMNRPGVQAQQAQLQEVVEQVIEGGDDLEAGVEDDMEGALEAIGLRGPIFGVVQNALLMILVLDTAIGFGIWVPFTLGKTMALLSLDPPRALHILHLPIRAMRVITDPVVDTVTFILGRSALPLFYRIFEILFHFTLFGLLEWLRSPPEDPTPGLSSHIDKFFESESMIARFLEPYFAWFGREIRLVTERAQRSWVQLTLGHGTPERIFAIGLGYVVVAVCLALYLNVFNVGNARNAGRAVRNAVRQQLLVVKVAMFIIIELVIFPLGCGIMLDACTIWVFPEASIESRLAFFTQAPLTAMFYHWVAGTMFMYQFAILLAGCRSIMRPGAMWFIKDPQDQNFHPIRDILDRPTLTQFRKLLISAFMYSMVVACGVGSLAVLLFIGSKSIFPIRWKTREPLSDVPIDLLFLQIVLPYTLRYLRPRKVLHKASVHVWRFLASKLRLTSYMFGERHSGQEKTVRYRTWGAFFRRSNRDMEEVMVEKDGTFRRVPASDNIALPRDMRATAEVLETGLPANDAARDLIDMQNIEAAKAKRDIRADYIVVYFPPRFRARVLTFIAAVWTIVAVVAAMCIALPVQIGRRFFALFTPSELHDGYSFLAGFYLLWACYAIAHAADRMNKRRLRLVSKDHRPDFIVFFVKRSILWLSKIAYIVVFLGIIIPALLGLVADLYIILPIRLIHNPEMVPRIRMVDMWSLGIVYGKIAIRLRRRVQFPGRISQALQTLLSNGWSNPDPRHATKELIIPLIAGLLGMLAIPAGLVYLARETLELPLSTKFLFVYAYPGIFAAAGLFRMCASAMGMVSLWSQSIRDKEFLVEMRLQNHEPNKVEVKDGAVSTAEDTPEEHVR